MKNFRFLFPLVSAILSVLLITVMFASCSASQKSTDHHKDGEPTTTAVSQTDTDPDYSFDKKYYAKKVPVKGEVGNFVLVVYLTENDEKIVELKPSFNFSKIEWDSEQYKVTVTSADSKKSESYIYSENSWVKSMIQ